MLKIRITGSEKELAELYEHLDKRIFPSPPHASPKRDDNRYVGSYLMYADVDLEKLISLLKQNSGSV